MKKPLVIMTLVVMVGGTAARAALPINSVGSGGQMGFNAVGDGIGAAFGFGGHADIGLDLPIPLTLRYVPGVEIWMGSRDIAGTVLYDSYDIRYGEVNLNLFDARYYPPLPERLPITPYAGIGFPLSIHFWKYEYESASLWTGNTVTIEDSDADFGVGAMLISGTEFDISERLVPFAEMKLKLGSPVVYKLMAGLTIRFLNRGAAAADDDLGTSTIDMPGDGADESSESDDSIDFNDALEP